MFGKKFAVFLFLWLASIRCELLQVLELFRHGAREALFDWWNAEDFTHWGELTPVGMRQHYNLGQVLRKIYIDDLHFLSEAYNPDEIYVRSTDVNRTIMSAMSQLYGLYPLGSGPNLPEGLDPSLQLPPFAGINASDAFFGLPLAFQPIPIHIVPHTEDYMLLSFSGSTCEVTTEFFSRVENSEIYKKWNEDFKQTFEGIAQVLNLTEEEKNSLTIDKVSNIFDVFLDDIWANRPIPQNISKELWTNMTVIYNLVIYYNLGGISDISKFFSTPFFTEVIQSFDQKVQNPTYPLKWKMYSAHDWTVGSITPALNITNYQCVEELVRTGKTDALNCALYPDFATSLIIELYQEDAENFIKIRYNGNYVNLCERNDQKCLYSEFKQRLSDNLIDNFETICHTTMDFEIGVEGRRFLA